MPIHSNAKAWTAPCDPHSPHHAAKGPELPSGFTAEEHNCKVYIDDDVARIRCKCGWERVVTDSELWVDGEPWREIARAHVMQE